MSFLALNPATFSIVITQGAKQAFTSPVIKDTTGAIVNFSGWSSIQAKAIPIVPGVNTSDISFGTTTGDGTGKLTLIYTSADLTGATIGSANLIIVGKQSGGDDYQLLSTGGLTLQSG